MSISFECDNPFCRKHVRAPNSAVGKKAQCPMCGHIQIVPKPAETSSNLTGPADEPSQGVARGVGGHAARPITASDVVCKECGKTLPASVLVCSSCGWVNPATLGPMPVPAARAKRKPADRPAAKAGQGGTLGIECLKAIGYGTTNLKSICLLVVSAWLLAWLLGFLKFFFLPLLLGGVAGWVIYMAINGALAVVVGGFYLRFCLDCTISSLEGVDQAPIPEFNLSV